MKKKEIRANAGQLILEQIACVCYGNRYEEFLEQSGDAETAQQILKEQCDRVARALGEKEAWFY